MEGSKAILQALQDFKKQVNKVSETKSLNDKSIEEDYGVDVVLPKVLQAKGVSDCVPARTGSCQDLNMVLQSRQSLDRCSSTKERQNAGQAPGRSDIILEGWIV